MTQNTNNIFIEVSCKQQSFGYERICGDTFLYKRISTAGRVLIVLSDGMGHGVKANILSNITATMIANINLEELDIENLSKVIIKSLPVCEKRKVSYSTFSIVDINLNENLATIIEYDNPKILLFRNNTSIHIPDTTVNIESTVNRNFNITLSKFNIKEGDRIVLMTDGVTQSGTGRNYRFGWGRNNVESYIQSIINSNKELSSSDLATSVVNEAINNDGGVTFDDISCAVISIRKPKRTLFCSKIPTEGVTRDYIDMIENFEGNKVICGYYLATTISEISGKNIQKDVFKTTSEIQEWEMDGIDIITESMVTINQVIELLNNGNIYSAGGDEMAHRLTKLLYESDVTNFIIGRERNIGWVYKSNDYDLRHNLLLEIISILRTKYNKEININYL